MNTRNLKLLHVILPIIILCCFRLSFDLNLSHYLEKTFTVYTLRANSTYNQQNPDGLHDHLDSSAVKVMSDIHDVNVSMISTSKKSKERKIFSKWDRIQYDIGIFGITPVPDEAAIRSRCASIFFPYDPDPVGAIETPHMLCYCMRGYPEFLADERWLSHASQLESTPEDGSTRDYWFCAKPRPDPLVNWHKIDVDSTVVVVTGKYGYNDMFKEEVEGNCAIIKEMSHFDPNHVFCYYQSPNYVLEDQRFFRHLQYRVNPSDASTRGGGYWCHKSLVVRHKMREYKDGDYIIYIDNDRRDFLQQGLIHNIIETMEQRDADLAIELQIGCAESIYSKEDMLFAFNASDEMRMSDQVAANAFVIRNNAKMRKLMDVWAICVSDWHMVSDEPSILPNSPMFQFNVHDQSIFGLLIKTFMRRQAMIGPPSRPFRDIDTFHTWQLDDINLLHCPFPNFYTDDRSIIIDVNEEEPMPNITNDSDLQITNTIISTNSQEGKGSSKWDKVQYDSGIFGVTPVPDEGALRSMCASSHLLYDPDPVGAIETPYNLCYCMRGYPEFLHEERWVSHASLLGPAPDDGSIHEYWFCAKPRPDPEGDWSKFDVDSNSTIVVVTGKYGHNDMFKEEVEGNCAIIKEMRHFDPNHVFCYYQSPNYVLEDQRFFRHLQYRIDPNDASARGGGYWCHKSLVLRHKMREYKDGDYIIYIDNDRRDFLQQGLIHNIIETMAQRDADLAIELQIGCAESIYSKEDMLFAFNASDEMRMSDQVAANAFVIRNNAKMRKLIDIWAVCVSDWHMVSDEPSILPNSPMFMFNIHDQSIFGLLIKTFMRRQAMIGPPSRPFRDIDAFHTWQLDDINLLHCPLPNFYSDDHSIQYLSKNQ